uniref:huntingtin-interacting protein K-like n=1 Tax=Pristiophorus japonicus TaxID=55135 RepID=UPI00398E6076
MGHGRELGRSDIGKQVEISGRGSELGAGPPLPAATPPRPRPASSKTVTNYAEEKEILSSEMEMAMSVMGDRRSREQKAKQERDKELAKVTVKKEDVEHIMNEMEISQSAAEHGLREHLGNVVKTLIALTD